jgi:glutamate-1-semialdehyde 2,1-aminomutase
MQQADLHKQRFETTAIERDYEGKTTKSRRMFQKALNYFAGGQSHNARFFEPYPFFSEKARGKYIWDIDGNRYVDYWMGHTALIMGHSPRAVSSVLRKQVSNGLLFGTPNRFAFELGQLVSEIVPCAESIRFCTTGAEATMYAVRLARAYTARKDIVKMAGGWHGYSSSLTYGVSAPWEVPESAGLIPEEQGRVKLATFNSVEKTLQVISEDSKQIAAVIVEPVMGAGGVVPADKRFLQSLRKICDEIGALLIFDEIITGFRLELGGAQQHYSVVPDLCTLGKILGGGLPASAVAGRKDILALADTRDKKAKNERAWIGGGTFSEHALAMRAGKATIEHLRENRKRIYPTLNRLGQKVRNSIDQSFKRNGIRTESTGLGSLFATHFLEDNQENVQGPDDVVNTNKELQRIYYFSLLAEDNILFLPGHIGAISTAHSQSDIEAFVDASEKKAVMISAMTERQ